jgi:integrase
MATLFKPDRPYPLPPNADIVEKDGRPPARIRERGRAVEYPLTADRKQYLKPAAKWCADVRFANGKRRRVRFSPNRDAAAVMLADLLKKIENEKSGIRDQYADHRSRPLPELLTEYEQHHADRGNTPGHTAQVRRRCETVFEGCGFALLTDLDGTAADRWPSGRRQLSRKNGGMSAQTRNHYVTALKAFGNWLVKACRASENPFRHLSRVNVDVDLRHARRAMSEDEFARLLSAARSGASYRGVPGPDRAMLYLVAGMTGLRASELASLTPASFALDTGPPTVTVAAAYSKRRRRDDVPLHAGLVDELRAWLGGKPAGAALWPGKWAEQFSAAAMIRRDLDAALGVARGTVRPRRARAAGDLGGVELQEHRGRGDRLPRAAAYVRHQLGEVRGDAEGREGTGPALDDHPDDGPLRPRRHPGQCDRPRSATLPGRSHAAGASESSVREQQREQQRVRAGGDRRGRVRKPTVSVRHSSPRRNRLKYKELRAIKSQQGRPDSGEGGIRFACPRNSKAA